MSIGKNIYKSIVSDIQVAKMVLVVVAAFTISWTPYFLVSIVTQYQEVNFMVKHNYFFTMLCINMFGFLNSSINPIIYAVMSTRFRNGFASIARTLLLCSTRKSRRRRSLVSTGAEASGRPAASGSASGASNEPVVSRQAVRLTVAANHDSSKVIASSLALKSTTTTSTAGPTSGGSSFGADTGRASTGSRFLIRPFETLSNYHRK
jgi:hypothetical protein